MGRPEFGQPASPLIAQHLHNDDDVVDGDAVDGLQHGLPTELEAKAESTKLEPTDPLEFRWRVPLS